jgi:glycosyltransferase involved in cell wall biosynthesis
VTTNPTLSVIICTYNRAPWLAALLKSLSAQSPGDLVREVLVIDNNCSDDTAAVAVGFAERLPVRLVREPRQGLAFARNRGIAEANCEALLFLDDDAIVPDGYFEALARVLALDPDLFGGPIEPLFETPPPMWFPPEVEIRRYADQAGFSGTAILSGGNFGIMKHVVERVGLFDERLGMVAASMGFGEDREMVERYRRLTSPPAQRLYYDPKLSILHRVSPKKITRRYQLERSFCTAVSRERVFISVGLRSRARARWLAAGRLAMSPLTLSLTALRHGLSPRGRFLALYQLFGLAGRFVGAFSGRNLDLR